MRWLIKGLELLLAPTAKQFGHALSQPQAAQRTLQTQLFQQVSQSDYGRSLGIKSIDDWHQIPIVTYDALRPWIEQRHSLTAVPVLFYEPTSGSRGPAKHIPYTRALRQSFNTLFCIWAHDLISTGPRIETGNVYMCISPKLMAPREPPAG